MNIRRFSLASFLGACSLVILGSSLFVAPAFAEDFDWRNVNGGQYFVSPVKNQFYGTCWAHGNIGCLEAKYMLTRNDPNFSMDLSEENLVIENNPGAGYPDMGSTNGGGPYEYSFDYFSSHGIVAECELPGTGDEFNGTDPNTTGKWPLQPGWANRVVKTAPNSYRNDFAQMGTQAVKNALKMYGPLSANMAVDNDWWPNPGAQGGAHTILIVGYHDDPTIPGGGEWIIKNSWDTGWGDGGYGYIPYAKRPYQYSDANAITGPAYYTGTMYYSGTDQKNPANYHTGTAAMATWTGSANSTWSTTQTNNWKIGSTAFTWVNQEVQATFGTSATNRNITISGTAIAHGIVIDASATGYTFTGGALTVTAGGITANESTTINSALTIGGPQTWTVAANKTLTVNGAMHTIISDTTVSGSGNVVIAGAIDGGGVLNANGAKPGGIIKSNSGTLTFTGNSNYGGDITVYVGTLAINTPGDSTYSGAFLGDAGSGGLTINSPGTVSIGGGASAFPGTINVQTGTLQFIPAASITGTFSGKISGNRPIVQNGPGTTKFTAINDYTGDTTIKDGALQANSGTGLPTNSFLKLDGGVLQDTNGTTFTRSLGTSGSTFQWTANGGGFSAGSTSMLTVKVNNGSSQLVWGSNAGTQIVGTLKLSSTTAAGVTDFTNAINLNGATRTIQVNDNPALTTDYARISGAISGTGSSSSLQKTGDGLLLLSTTNSYAGSTIISGGALQATVGSSIPGNSFISLDGGVYQSNGLYTFNRSLGTSGSTFQWTANGGGFSGGSGALTVNIGSGTSLTWGNSVGSQIVGTLKLSSPSATNTTTFANNINLNGGDRTINVDDNTASTNDYAILSGVISGTGNLTKTGLGKLVISGSAGNTYTGTTTLLGGNVDLNKTSGFAIPGNLVLGGVTNYKVRLVGANQIPSSASLTWNSSDNVGLQRLELMGHNLTVTGITDLIAHGAIENSNGESAGYGTYTLTVNNTADCTYSGYLRDNDNGSGKIAVAKTGSGTLTLSGGGYDDNISYSGGTTVSGGTLVFHDILYCPISNYNVALSNNAALVIDSSANFNGVISGTGSLTKKSNGNLTFDGGGNTYTGATNINDGTATLAKDSGYAITGDFTIANANTYVVVKNANQFPATAKVTFAGTGDPHFEVFGNSVTVGAIIGTAGGAIENTEGETERSAGVPVGNGTLIVNNAADCSYSGIIRNTAWGNGTLALVKNGSGKLTLTGGYSGGYTGGLTVNAGTLDYSGGTLPGGNYTITGGTLNIGAKSATIGGFQITGGTVSGTGTLTSATSFDIQSGSISPQLSGVNIPLTKTGSGTAILTGANSYTGPTTISGGVLQASPSIGLSSSSYLQLDGGVLQSNGTGTVLFTRNLSATAGGNNFQWTANGGGFAAGAGLMNIRIGFSTTAVNWGDAAGANIAGTLKLSSNTAANLVDFQNAINLNGKTRTIQVDDNPGSTADAAKISGIIANGSGTGGILKTGSGTLTLSAVNSYTGATTISAGDLVLSGYTPLNAASAVSIAASSNLIFNGGTNCTFANTVSGTGGIIAKNSAANGITVTLSGNMNSFTGKITADAKARINGLQTIGNLGNIDVQVNDGGQVNVSTGATFTAKSMSIAGQGWSDATVGPAGALRLDNGATYTGSINLAANAAISSSGNGYVTGSISGPAIYQLQILPVWNGSTQITLSGNNRYGSTLVGKYNDAVAVLVAGSAEALGLGGASGPLTLDGGTVKLNGFSYSFDDLISTAQGGLLENGSATPVAVTLGLYNSNPTYGGGIDDGGPAALSLVKTGTGTLTLSGPLSYTGNTSINGGTLQINSPSATLTTITGLGILSLGPDAILTASSIDVSSLNIGITSGLATVPEPSTFVLLAGLALAGLVLSKGIRGWTTF